MIRKIKEDKFFDYWDLSIERMSDGSEVFYVYGRGKYHGIKIDCVDEKAAFDLVTKLYECSI